MSRHQPVSPFERSLFHRKGSAGAAGLGRLTVSPELAAAKEFALALQRQVQSPGPRFTGTLFGGGEKVGDVGGPLPVPAYRVDNPLSGLWEYSQMLLNPGWIALMGNGSYTWDTFRLRIVGHVAPTEGAAAQWIALPMQWQQLLVYSGGGPGAWAEPGLLLKDPREIPVGYVKASF